MVSLRRSLLIITSLLLMVFVAACGGSSPTTGQSSSTSATAKQSTQQAAGQPTSTYNDQNNTQINGQDKAMAGSQNGSAQANDQNGKAQATGQNANTQATGQNATNGQVKTQVNGTGGTGNTNTFIRATQVNLNGSNVLVLTSGTGMTLYYLTNGSACTGSCTQTWIPFTGSGTLISSQALPGSLTFSNGNQVTYSGHPLYTYSGDTAPGQINGQGVGGVWVAATIIIGKQEQMHW